MNLEFLKNTPELSSNLVLIVVLGFLLGCVIVGLFKGMVKSAFATFSMIIAIVAAAQLSPYVGKLLQKTPVYTSISTTIEEQLIKKENEQATKVTEQIEAINGLGLPSSLTDALLENNNQQIYTALGVDDLNQYMSGYLACLILQAAAWVVVFIAACIILKLIEATLDLISKIPVLNMLNRTGGLVFGLANGVMKLWIACLIVTMFASTAFGEYIFTQINNNTFLSFIYNHNYFMEIVSNMGKMLF